MSRRGRSVFVAGLGLATVLAACGDSGDSGSTSTSEAGTTATTVASATDSVSVNLAEYTFGVSGPLKAGGTIKLSNLGKEFHMMGLGKLKAGKTLDDVKAALAKEPPEGAEGEQQDPTKDVVDEIGAPGTIMGPGQSAEITAPNLAEGTYALVCFIPVEGGGPPHFTKGMIGQLSVVAEKAAVPKADATFTIAPGKPVLGPATLTPGKHVIEFKAAPGSEQLEPGMAKLDDGKTVADINRAFKAFETGNDFVLPVDAASKVPGQLLAGVFDLHEATSVYLGVTLTPGTYGIDAHDSDPDNAPVDPVEKATITVK